VGLISQERSSRILAPLIDLRLEYCLLDDCEKLGAAKSMAVLLCGWTTELSYMKLSGFSLDFDDLR
jgi:hypothetical protein